MDDKHFPKHLQDQFKQFRQDGLFCDFEIVLNGKIYPVHKVVLAAASDYFKAMLSTNLLESQMNKLKLTENENIFHENVITNIALEAILDFCYTAKLTIEEETVQEILVAASKMQINQILDICSEYIKPRIDTTNCIVVLQIADTCNIQGLKQIALNYCLDKFEEVIEKPEFLYLDEELLIKILSHDELYISSEEKVSHATIKWIKAGERTSSLVKLMECVRFPFIEPTRLGDLLNTQLIKNTMECRDLIDDTYKYHLTGCIPPNSGRRFVMRVPLRKQQRIFAVGGWTNEFRPISSVERYDPYLDTWTEVNPMTKPRCGVGVVILDDSLYAIGGHDGQSYLKSAERYDIREGEWYKDVADMQSERTSVCVIALNGFIYAIGGQFRENSCDSVERYNPSKNVWEQCSSLQEKRLGAGVAVLDGMIYVMGGGAGQLTLDSVERYDPSTDIWTYVACMNIGRKHLGCASYGGKIYAVGGRGDTAELSEAECYDPVQDSWKPITDMSEKRSGIGLVELDGLLYAAGGHNGDVKLRMLEAYNPTKDEWTMKKPLIYERLGGGLVAYSKYKNMIAN